MLCGSGNLPGTAWANGQPPGGSEKRAGACAPFGRLARAFYELWDYDLEEAGRLAEESYQLAVGAHYTMGIVRGLTDIGMYRYYRGDYPQGSLYFHRAIAACQGRTWKTIRPIPWCAWGT